MVGLLDINFLVALFDPAHAHHEAAHGWLEGNRVQGWATCPLTENGFIRVVANPGYPGCKTSVGDAIDRLRAFRDSGQHTFWPSTVSLLDDRRYHPRHIQGHQQLTDIYLLGLAVSNAGRLVTFDTSIQPRAVCSATSANLVVVRP